MRRGSLAVRVVGVLALAALIPTLAIGALAFARTRADLEREVTRGHLALIRALGAGVDATLQDARRTIEIAAATWADARTQAEPTDAADGRATARLRARLERDVPVIARLAIVSPRGTPVAGGPLPPGVDLGAGSFGGYVGDAGFGDGGPRVPLVVQARSRTGELCAVFVAEIDLAFVSTALRGARLPAGAQVVVVDGRGTTVAGSDPAVVLGADRRGEPAIARALGASAEGHLTEGGVLAVYRSLSSYQSLRGVRWAIVLTQPEHDAYAVAVATQRLTLVVAAVALLLAIALGALLAARLTRPLVALTARADAIARGDTSAAPVVRGPGELGHLATRVEEMAVRIGERAELQTALARGDRLASVGVMAAQVAHEINNPLTTVLGYAALLAEDKADDHPDRAGLELIAAEATRMKSIVAGLLGYARAETAGDRPEATAPGAVGRLVAALLAPSVRKAGATLTVDLDGAPPIAFDSHALQQVLVNLVTNALHATPGGAVTVAWQAAPGGAVAIDVCDDGPGIAPADRPRVFDPFVTTKAAGVGTGLGLAVVRHLVTRAGATIAVDAAPAGGARFRLTVAAAPVVPPPGDA
ncbi:MAG: sensor histidine kinase [Kofleriaceae bacterium]